MSTKKKQLPSLLSLGDDILVYCLTYLEFADVKNSISKLNRHFNILSNDKNAISHIKNYPLRSTTCLLIDYIKVLIINQNVSCFNYHVSKLDWIHSSLFFQSDDNSKFAIETLFHQLKHLKLLKFLGPGDFLQHLPLQTHLTHLILKCNDQYIWEDEESLPTQFTIPNFLSSRIDVNSLYLLQEFTISEMTLNVESLQVLSNMINLEIFRFEGLQYNNVDQQLIENTFSKWRKLQTLDCYTQKHDQSTWVYSTFEDDKCNDAVLKSLLSIRTLKNLKFSVSPWTAYIEEDGDKNAPFASRITRIFPAFRGLHELETLEYCIFEDHYDNILLMNEILQIIKIECNTTLKKIAIKADTWCYISDGQPNPKMDIDKFKRILFQSFSMTDSYFEISLPQKQPQLLMIFANIMKQYHFKKKLKKLLISIYCHGMTWKYFVNISSDLSQILHEKSDYVRIELEGESFATRPGDEWWTRLDGTEWDGCCSVDSNEDDDVPYVHKDWIELEQQLKTVGFRLDCAHKCDLGVYVESLNNESTNI